MTKKSLLTEEEKKAKRKSWYEANKENLKEKRKVYTKNNKAKIATATKVYYEANKETIRAQQKGYQEENRAELSAYMNEYVKNRKIEDPLYHLAYNMRCRTSAAFKEQGYHKISRTADMLGADWQTVKEHIQSLFYGEMNWDNQGTVWHVDHVYPVSSAEDESHLVGLMHYLNLQPLFAADNSSKCDMMPEDWVVQI